MMPTGVTQIFSIFYTFNEICLGKESILTSDLNEGTFFRAPHLVLDLAADH